MKVLFVLGKYLPGKNGGIENYTHWLATLLLQNGHYVSVAILEGNNMKTYAYEGVKIIPLPDGLTSFLKLIDNSVYDICHFHEYSGESGINTDWVVNAKYYCKKVFFTFHLPYLTCYKNDFRFKGIEDCKNFSDPRRCAQCIIATRLNYKPGPTSVYNTAVDWLTPFLMKTKKIRKIINSIVARRAVLSTLINNSDQIFLLAGWFTEILHQNGYQSDVLTRIPPVSKSSSQVKQPAFQIIAGRIVFAGRIEQQKGLHLLCKAMNLLTEPNIQLEVFGDIVNQAYFNKCQATFNFNYHGLLPRGELQQLLPQYDFLVLPSVFTEMYPMILQEAFYEHLPVIASGAKGNKELIREGVDGFLFEYNSYADLARVVDHAYALKKAGWKAAFQLARDRKIDESNILAYYNL